MSTSTIICFAICFAVSSLQARSLFARPFQATNSAVAPASKITENATIPSAEKPTHASWRKSFFLKELPARAVALGLTSTGDVALATFGSLLFLEAGSGKRLAKVETCSGVLDAGALDEQHWLVVCQDRVDVVGYPGGELRTVHYFSKEAQARHAVVSSSRLVVESNNQVQILDVRSFKILSTFEVPVDVTGLYAAKNSAVIVVAGDGKVFANGGETSNLTQLPISEISALSDDGRWLLTEEKPFSSSWFSLERNLISQTKGSPIWWQGVRLFARARGKRPDLLGFRDDHFHVLPGQGGLVDGEAPAKRKIDAKQKIEAELNASVRESVVLLRTSSTRCVARDLLFCQQKIGVLASSTWHKMLPPPMPHQADAPLELEWKWEPMIANGVVVGLGGALLFSSFAPLLFHDDVEIGEAAFIALAGVPGIFALSLSAAAFVLGGAALVLGILSLAAAVELDEQQAICGVDAAFNECASRALDEIGGVLLIVAGAATLVAVPLVVLGPFVYGGGLVGADALVGSPAKSPWLAGSAAVGGAVVVGVAATVAVGFLPVEPWAAASFGLGAAALGGTLSYSLTRNLE
ncbi:MAG: hypothetical protein GY822_17630 [Deltaproteobacteria bacterium]|nr:hypothetical protein [Deltaproteobacteria bacterium]